MKSARGYLHWSLAVGVAFAVALFMPAAALASSGEITRAEAIAEWTQGSVAGSVTWTGCANAVRPPTQSPGGPESPPPEPAYCAWIPYATIGPASSSSDCSAAARQLHGLGEGVSLVWSGGERQGVGSAEFDLTDVSLSGEPEQLLCLSATEYAQTDRTIPCMPPGEPLPPGWHCPYAIASYPVFLAEMMLVTQPESEQSLAEEEPASSPIRPKEPPPFHPVQPGESAVSPGGADGTKHKRCFRLRAHISVCGKPTRCNREHGCRGAHKRGTQN
jgi:hypothetical protein